MKLASWNVNSVRARLENVLSWLEKENPDLVCLQETKCEDHVFPREPFEDLGYNLALHGQKTFNGVAILSKYPFEEIHQKLPGDEDDLQARYLEAVIAAPGRPWRVASLYVPNGNPVFSGEGSSHLGDKFMYKLAWLKRLRTHIQQLLLYEEPLVLAGDYNIIPREEDVHDPKLWRDDALFRPESRAAFHALSWLGLSDAYIQTGGRPHQYTFWDYKGGAWPKNQGIRIDHILLSPQASDCLDKFVIDSPTRSWKKPSDHVPVTAYFSVSEDS